MTTPLTPADLAEADHLVRQLQDEAVRRVAQALGPGPAAQEHQLLTMVAGATNQDPR